MKSTYRSQFLLCLAFLLASAFCQAQSVPYKMEIDDAENMPNFTARLYPEFFIAPGDRELTLPMNLVADGRFWVGKIADVRAGVSIGSNTGLHFGGTFHLRDHVRSRSDKFVLSRSSSGRTVTTKFIKAPVQSRGISGPCADVYVGKQMGPFTARVDLGWEFQGYRHSQMVTESGQYISGNLNGYHSLKFQAVFQGPIPSSRSYFSKEGPYITEKFNAFGFGGQVALDYNYRPWRSATLYAGISMGYIKVAGDGSAPILSARIGIAVARKLNLF